MEDKKAIGLLKHHINTWEGKFSPAHFEACEIAIQALEKQEEYKTKLELIKYDIKESLHHLNEYAELKNGPATEDKNIDVGLELTIMGLEEVLDKIK